MTPLGVLRSYGDHGGTLTGLIRSRAAVRGDAPFLRFEGHDLSWSALEGAVAAVAGAYAARGVGPGDRVAILSPSRPEVLLSLLALARLGAWMVPVNPDLHPRAIRHILDHAGVSGVACTPATAGSAAGAPGWRIDLDGLASTGADPVTEPRGGADDVCIIVYTSGTTGDPKGVLHSQRNLVLAGEGFVERMRLVPDDRLLMVLPLFHINALFYSFCGALAAGASVVLAPRFSAYSFWRLAAESGATQVNLIAAVGAILARRPRTEWVPHRIGKVYGAPIPPEVERVFREELGVAVLVEGYGMTEVPGVLTNSFPGHGENRIGTLGQAARHPDPAVRFAELRVVDREGRDVGDGAVGELLVRTPAVMKGYHRDPVATAAAFTGGWFRTGDLVRRDAGTFTFVARDKDIIRRRGENVAGATLDRVLAAHPDVALAAAIGVPSPLGEEDILVAVVPRAGAALTADAVVAWMGARLAAHQLPRFVLFRDDLPRTATHRVAKAVLRAEPGLVAEAIEVAPPPKG